MPISIRQRVTTCLVAVLVCAVGAGASAAQPPPPGAGLQTERFRLVVEGDAEAVRDLDLGGDNGVCNAQVNVHVRETATWQRGRGVVVEFTRLGTGPRAPVFMRRVGSARPIFTVVVAVTRTSSGSATRTPSGPPEACPPLTEDLAQGPDCGVPQRDRAAISMLYAGGLMRMSHSGLGPSRRSTAP